MSQVELKQITSNAEKHLEECARECYGSLHKITETSHEGFLYGALKRGHFSILSYAHATFKITEYSRAATHQHVRHAHLRYLQRSQRYCTEEQSEFIIPPDIQEDVEAMQKIGEHMSSLIELYVWLIGRGYKREDARYFLPSACESRIVTSATLQGWWDFLRLRMDKSAQWEIRQVAQEIYKVLNKACPNIFNSELLVVQPRLNLDFPGQKSIDGPALG